MRDTWLKWVLAGLLTATLGSYAWGTKVAWRVEDRAASAIGGLEQRLEKRLDRLEEIIIEQFKRAERARK